MFQRRNGNYSLPKQQQQEQAYYDDSYVSAFNNLTLSDIPSEEITMSNHNQLAAAAAARAMYLPRTLDCSPISGARSSFAQQIRNNRGMIYNDERQIIGMGQSYPPNMFTAASSPSLGYQFPNNPAFLSPAEDSLITVDMLCHILHNPFEYMTNSTLNRPLITLLIRCRRTKFIDEFIQAITRSRNSLVDAACNYHGTCVIQTLLKVAKKRPVIARVPLVLADATLLLMTDQSGMHAIKQCFVELEDEKYVPLFQEMMENDNWLYIAKDKHGCRGLNECLDYMVDSFKSLLLTRIALSARDLAMDIYGTYVLQHVIDLRTIHTEQIVDSILPVIETLVQIKNGSHLIEKCLDTSYCSRIVQGLVNTQKVVRFALHECANYVIQKAIKRTRGRDCVMHEKLIKDLSKERSTLQVNKHGKYVAKLLPEI